MSLGKLVGGVAALPDEVCLINNSFDISRSDLFWQQAKRRISSIIGAVVADAASLPLEWIYKDATMKVK